MKHLILSVALCVPSLEVGDLPVRGCYLFAKYGAPDCGPSPTWEADEPYALSYWRLAPMERVRGPHAGVASARGPAGVFVVTVTGSTGATRTQAFEMLEGGACRTPTAR